VEGQTAGSGGSGWLLGQTPSWEGGVAQEQIAQRGGGHFVIRAYGDLAGQKVMANLMSHQ